MQKNLVFQQKIRPTFHHSKPILSNTFIYESIYQKKIHVQLKLFSNNFILVQDQYSSPRFYQFNPKFQHSFEILYTQYKKIQLNRSCSTEASLNQMNSMRLKFSKEKNKYIEFSTADIKIAERWHQELSKIMTQKGFDKKFKTIKSIGKGNFGQVYHVKNIKTNKNYAAKCFNKKRLYAEQKGKQILLNQIKINRMINDQNIAKLEGVFETQNSIYLLFQYIDGYQLKFCIDNILFTDFEIKHILFNLILSLTTLKKLNIVHRDLKPENIIIKKDKLPVIIDFGLATEIYQQQYILFRCGTPGYVAPQIIHINDINQKIYPISDIFSLGCIFYEMLFKKSIFSGDNIEQILIKNNKCNLAVYQQQLRCLPCLTRDLLQSMLKKDVGERITIQQARKHEYFEELKNRNMCKKGEQRIEKMKEYKKDR